MSDPADYKATIARLADDQECPHCGEVGFEVTWRLRARPIGSFSLAGSQMKVSAREVPHIKCRHCGVEATAQC